MVGGSGLVDWISICRCQDALDYSRGSAALACLLPAEERSSRLFVAVCIAVLMDGVCSVWIAP